MSNKKTNPFLKRLNPNSSFEHGRRSEENLSRRLGLRKQPGSGNMEGAKGDLKGQEFLVEAKATENKTMSVELSWLHKIKYEARDAGKLPALSISFVTKNGKPKKYGSWIMMEEHVFQEFMALVDEKR